MPVVPVVCVECLAAAAGCEDGPPLQASNVATYIAHGDVALSVLMTTASTLGAIFMTPLLTKLLAGTLVPVDAKVTPHPGPRFTKPTEISIGRTPSRWSWECSCPGPPHGNTQHRGRSAMGQRPGISSPSCCLGTPVYPRMVQEAEHTQQAGRRCVLDIDESSQSQGSPPTSLYTERSALCPCRAWR